MGRLNRLSKWFIFKLKQKKIPFNLVMNGTFLLKLLRIFQKSETASQSF